MPPPGVRLVNVECSSSVRPVGALPRAGAGTLGIEPPGAAAGQELLGHRCELRSERRTILRVLDLRGRCRGRDGAHTMSEHFVRLRSQRHDRGGCGSHAAGRGSGGTEEEKRGHGRRAWPSPLGQDGGPVERALSVMRVQGAEWPQPRSKAPLFISCTKAFHEVGTKEIEGPSGAFESRTAMVWTTGDLTSTHAPFPPEYEDLVHVSVAP
ncbi:hypothetical protein CU044_2483 [Streptomyces sp. L-9-10]|nr:hypothetical protein CU044_2483 [Streptomyces sp. L-9-10]